MTTTKHHIVKVVCNLNTGAFYLYNERGQRTEVVPNSWASRHRWQEVSSMVAGWHMDATKLHHTFTPPDGDE